MTSIYRLQKLYIFSFIIWRIEFNFMLLNSSNVSSWNSFNTELTEWFSMLSVPSLAEWKLEKCRLVIIFQLCFCNNVIFCPRWNYWLAGGLHPRGFHLMNVALHAIVSMLSLAIFNLLLGGDSHRAALLASVLFAVHPIHAEAVSKFFYCYRMVASKFYQMAGSWLAKNL